MVLTLHMRCAFSLPSPAVILILPECCIGEITARRDCTLASSSHSAYSFLNAMWHIFGCALKTTICEYRQGSNSHPQENEPKGSSSAHLTTLGLDVCV